MASASDTYTWAAYGDQLKAYLGVTDASEDTLLSLWLQAAARDCDDYVGHDWTDDEGADEEHGPKVWLGICEWVRVYRAAYQRGAGTGITSARTGPLAETYGSGVAAAPSSLARAAAVQLWRESVEDVSGMGVLR